MGQAKLRINSGEYFSRSHFPSISLRVNSKLSVNSLKRQLPEASFQLPVASFQYLCGVYLLFFSQCECESYEV
jgi:hypothetical protein